MSKEQVPNATDPEPHGRRAGVIRVIANAVLVLLAFEVVSLLSVTVAIVAGVELHERPAFVVALVAIFVFARWVYVLPALLVVLVGIEFVARRIARARILTAIVAFAPMLLWELTKSPGGFPSEQGAVLGATAVLFAILARLPARLQPPSTDGLEAAQPPAVSAVSPR